MNKRIAKKVVRNITSDNPNYMKVLYSCKTIRSAYAKAHRSWCRYGKWRNPPGFSNLTKGFRWGRWDPHIPLNPNDVPF